MASRQRKWQKKMVAEGKCCECGKPSAPHSYCEYHRQKLHEKYLRQKARKLNHE